MHPVISSTAFFSFYHCVLQKHTNLGLFQEVLCALVYLSYLGCEVEREFNIGGACHLAELHLFFPNGVSQYDFMEHYYFVRRY